MKIHEYQAKELFRKYGVPAPEGRVAFSPAEAVEVARSLAKYPVVIKAQIHAGGRGKGGGVQLAHSEQDVADIAGQIIGMNLITHQTGPRGQEVKKVLVEQGLDIAKELYLSIVPDRAIAKIVIMASEAGGMDIEEVAAATPEKIIKVAINPLHHAQHRKDSIGEHYINHTHVDSKSIVHQTQGFINQTQECKQIVQYTVATKDDHPRVGSY